MLASFLKRDLKNLIQRDATLTFKPKTACCHFVPGGDRLEESRFKAIDDRTDIPRRAWREGSDILASPCLDDIENGHEFDVDTRVAVANHPISKRRRTGPGGAIPKRGDFDSTIRSLPATTCDKRVEDPRKRFQFRR